MNFSVIIPMYNKQKYIQRAISSVMTQKYPNYELIVVDDGSTDESYKVACEIIDPRIRFFRQENHGVSTARNTGVNAASYPLVAFLDADDEWRPTFLETLSRLVNDYPECVLFASSYEINQDGQVKWYGEEVFPVNWQGVLPNYLQVAGRNPFYTSSVAIKLDVLQKIGGFPVGIKFGEDVATWIRCSLIGNFAFTNQPLVTYHREGSGASTKGVDRRQEIYPVTVLKELLREDTIPTHDIQFAHEFIARAEVKRAEAYFHAGQPGHALLYMWKTRKSPTYRSKILPMLRRELLPSMKKMIWRTGETTP
jgi:GT2 family glycosyltransferase